MMFYFVYYGPAAIISLVILIALLAIKRKPILWIFLFCLALIPVIALILMALYAMFSGSGLVGDSGGITSGMFVVVISFIYQCYIYIPALILLGVSFYQLFIKNNKSITHNK